MSKQEEEFDPFHYQGDERRVRPHCSEEILNEIQLIKNQINKPKEFDLSKHIVMIISVIFSGFSVYLAINNDIIMLKNKVDGIIEKVDENEKRHIILHDALEKKFDKMSEQNKSLETSVYELMRRIKWVDLA